MEGQGGAIARLAVSQPRELLVSITIQKFPPINIQFFPLVMAGQES
jgi:hypothetical protein